MGMVELLATSTLLNEASPSKQAQRMAYYSIYVLTIETTVSNNGSTIEYKTFSYQNGAHLSPVANLTVQVNRQCYEHEYTQFLEFVIFSVANKLNFYEYKLTVYSS